MKSLAVLTLFFLPIVHTGYAESNLLDKVKAAYLYNFTKFVEWPESKLNKENPAINICTVGKDPLGEILQKIEKKSSQGYRIKVNSVSSDASASSCHMVFIGVSEEEELVRIIENIRGDRVLTVSDIKGFAKKGGMIEFVVNDQGKLVLRISLKEAHLEKLKISAKLLEIASVIE